MDEQEQRPLVDLGAELPPEVRLEQLGSYPLAERALVDLVGFAEVGEQGDITKLRMVVLEALAFQEGLTMGAEGYRLDDENDLLHLQGMFTTQEWSTARPRTYYLEPALENALSGRVREARFQQRFPSLWKDLTERRFRSVGIKVTEMEPLVNNARVQLERARLAESDLVALENHVRARRVLDTAFLDRQGTCADESASANLLSRNRMGYPPTTPDRVHWEAFFYGEWGDKVDKVAREMVRVAYVPDQDGFPGFTRADVEHIPGVPENFYAITMEDTRQFKAWIKHMFEKADGRGDVVWAAWRFLCVTEIISELGKTTNDRGEVVFGNPPVINALCVWTSHLRDKRRMEFGFSADGRLIHEERFISHSGHPITLNTFKALLRSYFHSASVEIVRDGKKVEESLFKIWWGDGKRTDEGGTGVSLASPEFPWRKTETVLAGQLAGEPPAGSFDYHLLQRKRAASVVEDIRSTPNVRDLGDPNFFSSRVRNWTKIFGRVPTTVDPRDNPRAMQLLAWLYNTKPGTGEAKVGAVEGMGEEARYRTWAQGTTWVPKKPGLGTEGGIGLGDILKHAENCGWIRRRVNSPNFQGREADWIVNQLGASLG